MFVDSKHSTSPQPPFDEDETGRVEELPGNGPYETEPASESPSADRIEPSDFNRVHLIEEKTEQMNTAEPVSPIEPQKDNTPSNIGASNSQPTDILEETADLHTTYGSAPLSESDIDLEMNESDSNRASRQMEYQFRIGLLSRDLRSEDPFIGRPRKGVPDWLVK